MTRIPSWLMVIVAVVLAVFGGAPFPRRTSTLCKCRAVSRSLSSGDTKAAGHRRQSDRRPDRSDPRQSSRLSRPTRPAFPGTASLSPTAAKMAKIHWNQKKSAEAPAPTLVPDTLHDVDFMVRDSKRFADSGNWGYAQFNYDAASDTFTPATLADNPPQGNDAKCGFACHTIVKAKDYVFTAYPKR